jgi:heterodisulfide reductase subunit A
MLAVGIPDYRLPREVLQREVDHVCSMGVELRLNTPIARDGGPSLEDLRQEFGAVFVAVGAHGSRRMAIPGEEADGVFHGVSFLRRLNLGEDVRVGKRVAVVGGGNAAIDAARSALRLGAGEVQIVYRRTRAEMPAIAAEVEAAMHEGIAIEFLATPVKVLEKGGKVAGLECIRMELGEPDDSGRRRPIPVEGSEFTLDVDTVIVSIGQTIESDGLEELENEWGSRLVADSQTLACCIDGVFAGGDVVTGPASVVEAVGAGIEVAKSIHRYLRGDDLLADRRLEWPDPKEIEVELYTEVVPAEREEMAELDSAGRLKSFDEVELGLTEEQAVREAERCLSCAVCSECLQCVTACDRNAVQHDQRPETLELDVATVIVATGFDMIEPTIMPEFGYGRYPEVMTGLEFERLSSASGPTAGQILINGKEPQDVVFVHCVGSRDPHNGAEYCSRICCMYTAKHAHLVRDKLPDAKIQVFYMDVRAFGKGYEEFYDRVKHEGVTYRRGEPSEIYRNGDGLIVRAEDTLLRKTVEVKADLVVLATAVIPRTDSSEVAALLGLDVSPDGFFDEEHPKWRPVESSRPGVFLAGCCQSPKDVPDTVAQAKAAAASAMVVLGRKTQAIGS